MKITVSSPADAVSGEDDAPVDVDSLSLPFADPQIQLAHDLPEELLDIGVVGGTIEARRAEGKLWVDVHYWAPERLTSDVLERLVRETVAQWSDGAAEDGLSLPGGGEDVLIFPSLSFDEVVVRQEEDGRQVPAPSRIVRAARMGNLEEVKAALAAGDDLNVLVGGYSALQLAILAGHEEVALFLIRQGADVNLRDRLGTTALHLAASSSHLTDASGAAIAAQLLAHGADRGAADSSRLRAAEVARARGKIELARLLDQSSSV